MKPWQRWTLAATVVFVGYVLSPIPVLWMVERLGGAGARERMVFTLYLPIVVLCELAPFLEEYFYMPQDEWLRSVIGEP